MEEIILATEETPQEEAYTPEVLPLIFLGDENDGHLRTPAKPIEEVTDSVRQFCADLQATMSHYRGMGLAAPQVGVPGRVIVIRLGPDDFSAIPFINPEIVEREGTIRGPEACLSLPGLSVTLNRSEKVTVKATNLDGEEFEGTFEGDTAVVLQHEIDHLDGVLIVDRLKGLSQKRAMKRYRKCLRALDRQVLSEERRKKGKRRATKPPAKKKRKRR